MEVSVSLCTFIQCNSALFTLFRSVREFLTYRSPLYVHDVIKVITSVLIYIERKICGEKHVPTQLNILMNVGDGRAHAKRSILLEINRNNHKTTCARTKERREFFFTDFASSSMDDYVFFVFAFPILRFFINESERQPRTPCAERMCPLCGANASERSHVRCRCITTAVPSSERRARALASPSPMYAYPVSICRVVHQQQAASSIRFSLLSLF